MASTAIPTVKIIPAIPGNVSVASNNVKIPTSRNKLIINAVLAIKPKTLYLNIIKNITRKKPIIRANIPASIESWPKSGPTVRSSIIFNGAGRAPDLKSKARSVADWKVKSPLICPEPPIIASLITGALIIFPSNTIASLLPIPEEVALPNLLAPALSKEKDTIVSLFWLSIPGWASIKLSPLNIILLLTIASSDPSSKTNFSEPKLGSSFWIMNLNVKFAVLPKSDLILMGSSNPGNSTSILSIPLLNILGSLVPTSSIRLLTISRAWFNEDSLSSINPYLEYFKLKTLFLTSKSNSWVLNLV